MLVTFYSMSQLIISFYLSFAFQTFQSSAAHLCGLFVQSTLTYWCVNMAKRRDVLLRLPLNAMFVS